MNLDPRELVLSFDPCGRPNPALALAALRAGSLGVLDAAGCGPQELADLVTGLRARKAGDPAVRLSAVPGAAIPELLPALDAGTVVVLDARGAEDDDPGFVRLTALLRAAAGRRVLVEVTDVDTAAAAVAAGAAGLIAVGAEAGGRIGDTESFILLQQLLRLADGVGDQGRAVPIWVRGGIGLHTAAAAVAGGATGVCLDVQFALTPESGLGDDTRRAVAATDGSQTRVVGGHRIHTRPDLPSASVEAEADPAEVAARLGRDLHRDLLPFGQDAAFAATLARRFGTVGGIVQAVRAAVADQLVTAHAQRALEPGAGVAAVHGTRYPIVQGPMTRVSDQAAFAEAVADGGGLPFVALALMSGPDVRVLLAETARRLGDRPWGVGILGFVPAELREAQLEVVHDVRPPFALIAGGRPSQAASLEAAGITTYLHVPSPGLLERFVAEGARRFVFEGRECGGHVGPRSSLVLWQQQIEVLLRAGDLGDVQVLLAGGVHDGTSAAMAAAAAAPLVARGAQLGVLMGTGYLFAQEAVAAGAITAAYQQAAVGCTRTVLLETAPGHATRCVETEYVRTFRRRRAELEAAGVEAQERWAELESLNLGRLRMASKGVTRVDGALVELSAQQQLTDGMFMIGQVATLRDAVTTIEQLHRDVSAGSVETLQLRRGAAQVEGRESAPAPFDVAIVGMAATFPGAVDVEQFWANIVRGVDSVTEVPAERWDVDTYYRPDAVPSGDGGTTPSRWGGFLPEIGFDALKYGIPPASLRAIDPVQLLSLQVAAEALADAGYAEREFDRSRASVVFGAESGSDLSGAYAFRASAPQLLGGVPPELEDYLPRYTEDSFPGVLTNVIAGRIANRLDLGGVNYTVDAACASSLAALDAACKELAAGTSDVVLCGGADLHNGLNDYLLFSSVHALSPTGRCRTFDAEADGIALGEGIACLVLKRRADAERDGDRIYAVIDAVAGSSDGRHLGLTAPRKEGQQRAVARALAQSGLPATGIGLVEAHGTGTVVGDRTELATLTELFTEQGAAPGSVVVGSVKSNIGHTKCAAGLAGVIKAARAIHHGVLPPTLNVVEPNPYYEPGRSPFRLLDRARPWTDDVRRAGVSAFGFGGTNFHALLSGTGEPQPVHALTHWPAELFLIRAGSPAEGRARAVELAALVARIQAGDPTAQRHRLRDLARTVCAGGSGPVQLAVVADDLAQLAQRLQAAAELRRTDGVFAAEESPDPPVTPDQVAFVYPGQGSQRPGMTGDLFVAFPFLRDILATGEEWVEHLLPRSAFGREQRSAQQAAITATEVAQPALGMASLALTRLLRSLGVHPAMAGGHSYGELAALAAAGSIDDATLLRLSRSRGEAVVAAIAGSGGDPGAMAAVEATPEQLESRLAGWPGVVVANHNSPTQVVLSGPTVGIDLAVDELTAAGVSTRRLPVACAFHSPLVARAGELFADALAAEQLRDPAFPVWSNVTAEPYREGQIAALLARQVAEGVRFVEQIESMYAAGARVFVEAGPGRVLTQQVRAVLGDRPHRAIACDVAGDDGLRRLLLALAELAVLGVPVDPAPLFEGRAQLLPLRSLPLATPGWKVNGMMVRTADGEPVPGGLQPADRTPVVAPSQHLGVAGSPDAVVLEYLRGVRELVAAERDVMLRYLGVEAPGPSMPALEYAALGAAITPMALTGTASLVAPPAPAPAEVSAPVPAMAEPAMVETPSGEALLQVVRGIVSERTGYPEDMLDADLDLEADLSIDSIKRIEFIGELAERIGLAGAPGTTLEESVVQEFSAIKTLRGIVSWIDAHVASRSTPAAPALPGPVDQVIDLTDPALDAAPPAQVPATAVRYVVELQPLPEPEPSLDLAGLHIVVLTAEVATGSGVLAEALAQEIAVHGAQVDVARAGDAGAAETASADVVIHLAGLDPGSDARAAFAALAPAALGRARHLLAVEPAGRPTGVPGLFKALARELPGTAVRSVEIAPAEVEVDPETVAALLVSELRDLDGPVEVVRVGDSRSARVVTASPLPASSVPGGATGAGAALRLDDGAVVLVTGGARGITSAVAAGLGRATGCRLLLAGRTPLPGPEDPSLAHAADPQALRQALIAADPALPIARIEVEVRRLLAEREIRATLAGLAATGVEVEYHPIDVCDGAALTGLIDDVLARYGRLDGVLHGAGVLHDRALADKDQESFEAVYATKVDSARVLLERIPSSCRFVVFFGSVSGVFGNRGQVDYAAANDTLDRLADLANRAPDRRVVSIDWGPWGGGGMVSPQLEREYARRGVGLVDPAEGVEAVLAELALGPSGPSQVVVMRATPQALGAGAVRVLSPAAAR